jgi:hypothetical protein
VCGVLGVVGVHVRPQTFPFSTAETAKRKSHTARAVWGYFVVGIVAPCWAVWFSAYSPPLDLLPSHISPPYVCQPPLPFLCAGGGRAGTRRPSELLLEQQSRSPPPPDIPPGADI